MTGTFTHKQRNRLRTLFWQAFGGGSRLRLQFDVTETVGVLIRILIIQAVQRPRYVLVLCKLTERKTFREEAPIQFGSLQLHARNPYGDITVL